LYPQAVQLSRTNHEQARGLHLLPKKSVGIMATAIRDICRAAIGKGKCPIENEQNLCQ
jgi:hypothetical protein